MKTMFVLSGHRTRFSTLDLARREAGRLLRLDGVSYEIKAIHVEDTPERLCFHDRLNPETGKLEGWYGLESPEDRRADLADNALAFPPDVGMVMSAGPVRFSVPGSPVGKGRPRFARRGNFVTAYTPEATASYENLVKLKAEEAMQGREIIEGAVAVNIEVWIAPPSSWSKKKRISALMHEIHPTTKPDIDNIIKCICDAINGIVWNDDKQVCSITVTKNYANVPCVCVEIRPL